MSREPVLITSAVTAAILGALGLLAIFGLDVSQETQDKIVTGVASIVGALFVLAPLVRNLVYAPASVEKIEAGAQPQAADTIA